MKDKTITVDGVEYSPGEWVNVRVEMEPNYCDNPSEQYIYVYGMVFRNPYKVVTIKLNSSGLLYQSYYYFNDPKIKISKINQVEDDDVKYQDLIWYRELIHELTQKVDILFTWKQLADKGLGKVERYSEGHEKRITDLEDNQDDFEDTIRRIKTDRDTCEDKDSITFLGVTLRDSDFVIFKHTIDNNCVGYVRKQTGPAEWCIVYTRKQIDSVSTTCPIPSHMITKIKKIDMGDM